MFLFVWLRLYCFTSFSMPPSSCWFLFDTWLLSWSSFCSLTSLSALCLTMWKKTRQERLSLRSLVTFCNFYNMLYTCALLECIFLVIKKSHTHFVSETGKVDEKVKYLITVHFSKKNLIFTFCLHCHLGMFSGYLWIEMVFMLCILGDFVPSTLFVFTTFTCFSSNRHTYTLFQQLCKLNKNCCHCFHIVTVNSFISNHRIKEITALSWILKTKT